MNLKKITVHFIWTIFLSLNSQIVLANSELSFERNIVSEKTFLVVQSSDCDRLTGFVNDVKKWNFPAKTECAPSIKRENKLCRAEISQCLPPAVVKAYGNKFVEDWKDIDGPNCFGTALYTAGLSPAIAYTSGKNILGLLNEPVCKMLKTSDSPKVGDIGLVYKEDSLLHAFTYISSDYVWHKANMDSSSIPQIESMANMKENLREISSECRVCLNPKSKEDLKGMDCSFCLAPQEIKYFRCMNAEETYKAMRKNISKTELGNKLNQLDQVTCKLSGFVFQSGALTKTGAENIFSSLQVLAAYYHNEVNAKPIENPPKSERDWLLSMMALRIQSLKMQNETSYQMLGDEAPFSLSKKIENLLNLD
jgi:hypothetical protein